MKIFLILFTLLPLESLAFNSLKDFGYKSGDILESDFIGPNDIPVYELMKGDFWYIVTQSKAAYYLWKIDTSSNKVNWSRQISSRIYHLTYHHDEYIYVISDHGIQTLIERINKDTGEFDTSWKHQIKKESTKIWAAFDGLDGNLPGFYKTWKESNGERQYKHYYFNSNDQPKESKLNFNRYLKKDQLLVGMFKTVDDTIVLLTNGYNLYTPTSGLDIQFIGLNPSFEKVWEFTFPSSDDFQFLSGSEVDGSYYLTIHNGKEYRLLRFDLETQEIKWETKSPTYYRRVYKHSKDTILQLHHSGYSVISKDDGSLINSISLSGYSVQYGSLIGIHFRNPKNINLLGMIRHQYSRASELDALIGKVDLKQGKYFFENDLIINEGKNRSGYRVYPSGDAGFKIVDDKIYIAGAPYWFEGGHASFACCDDKISIYDLNAKSWKHFSPHLKGMTRPPNILAPNFSFYADEFFFWGNNSLYQWNNEINHPGYWLNIERETSIPDQTSESKQRSHASQIEFEYENNKYLFMYGGSNGKSNYFFDGGIYDLSAREWEKIETEYLSKHPRLNANIIHYDNYIVIWGGRSDNGLLDDGAIYNLNTKSWNKITDKRAPSSGISQFIVVEQNLYLYQFAKNKLFLFSPILNQWSEMPNPEIPAYSLKWRQIFIANYQNSIFMIRANENLGKEPEIMAGFYDVETNIFVPINISDLKLFNLLRLQNKKTRFEIYKNKLYMYGAATLKNDEVGRNLLLIYDFQNKDWEHIPVKY